MTETLRRAVEFLAELEKHPLLKSKEGCYAEEDENGVVSIRDPDGGLRVAMPKATYLDLLEYKPCCFECGMLEENFIDGKHSNEECTVYRVMES